MKTRKINTVLALLYISVFVVLAILQGCNPDPVKKAERQVAAQERQLEMQKRYEAKTKIIASKEAPIENRFSAGDFFFGEGSITKSQTVYYFVSTDGKMVEVDLRTYSTKKIGDSYSSTGWY